MSKIKDIRFTLKRYNYKKPFCIAYGFVAETGNIEIEVITENGVTG
ncbi:dipeptide epimerase, partial [bacterium]|nr:dipeptide epimerase [bacterium]